MGKLREYILEALKPWRSLGTRLTPTADLVGHVPHVAPEAFLHTVFSPIPSDAERSLQDEFGKPVPSRVLSLLREFNGLHLFTSALAVYGHSMHVSRNPGEPTPWLISTANLLFLDQQDLVAIGTWPGDGSEALLKVSTGEVLRTPREKTAPVLNTWPTVALWLSSELLRLNPLFDRQGRQRTGTSLLPS